MQTAYPDTRRQHERRAHAVAARLRAGEERLPCRLLDLSVGGAKVQLDVPVPAGTDFALEIGSFGEYRVSIVWQSGNDAGLRFEHPPAEMAEVIMGLAAYG